MDDKGRLVVKGAHTRRVASEDHIQSLAVHHTPQCGLRTENQQNKKPLHGVNVSH